MKKLFIDYAGLLVMASIIIGFDQWTKELVRTKLQFGEIWAPWPWLLRYARVVHWTNTGAAFGMFQGWGGVFTVLAIIVAIAILYYYPKVSSHDWLLRIAMGLQLAGAVGNLIDRVTHGSVTDFISVGNFAVFNVADASISTGVALLVIGMWIKEKEQKTLPETSPLISQTDPIPSSEETKGE